MRRRRSFPGIPAALVLVLFATSTAMACLLPPETTRPTAKNETGKNEPESQWVSASLSGAWYDPQRSGEGVVLQVLESGQVVAVWYTYPATGETGEQAWLISSEGRIEADRVRFANVLRPMGGRFGAAFDASAVRNQAWGRMDLRMIDCNTLEFSYEGPPAYGSGTRTLRRLTSLDQVGCAGERRLTGSGARAQSSLRGRSGAWYVPERAGEGWMLEELADGRASLYWFTFTPEGEQAWFIAIGQSEGDSYVFNDLLKSRGTRFGEAFESAQVELSRAGSLRLDRGNCSRIAVDYSVEGELWGEAQRQPIRLTRPAGASCRDAMPAAVSNLGWAERARMPSPFQSEHAAAVLDGKAYTLGGFGALRGLRRYDLETGSWAELAQLPAGRDHPASFAIDGHVYLVGGALNGGGDQTSAGFRYLPAQDRWEPAPEFRALYGSSAAILHGYAWIGDVTSELHQYDPRARRARRIPMPEGAPRDHSRVLAFMDEIWVIGGREPETERVDIYDPASGRWRAGPSLNRFRGGFAAATVGDRLVVTGGEVIARGLRIVPETEVYTAGEEAWQLAPALPVPVHGSAAVSVDGRMWVFGGSTNPGLASGASGRTYELTGLQ